MFARNQAVVVIFVASIQDREFGFLQQQAPDFVDLVEIVSPGRAQFLHFIRYDPFRDKALANVCKIYPGVNKLVEWFVARVRASTSERARFSLVVREIAPVVATQPAGCAIDEGLDPNVTRFMLARKRRAKQSRTPWRVYDVPFGSLSRDVRYQLRNVSVTARGTLKPR